MGSSGDVSGTLNAVGDGAGSDTAAKIIWNYEAIVIGRV